MLFRNNFLPGNLLPPGNIDFCPIDELDKFLAIVFTAYFVGIDQEGSVATHKILFGQGLLHMFKACRNRDPGLIFKVDVRITIISPAVDDICRVDIVLFHQRLFLSPPGVFLF